MESKFYTADKSCKWGHSPKRYVSNGECVACRSKLNKKVHSLKPTGVDYLEAMEKGFTTYTPEKPCKYGHSSDRYVTGKACIVCTAQRAKSRAPGKSKIGWEEMKLIIRERGVAKNGG